VAKLEDKLLVNIFFRGLERIMADILTNCRKKLLGCKWFAGAHDPLESSIRNSSFAFTPSFDSIVYLVVCVFEAFGKLTQARSNILF
jgi:hypothetical protein